MTALPPGARGTTEPRRTLGRAEIALGVILAGTSGAAIIAHTFGPLDLRFTSSFVVFPSAVILVCVILLARGREARMHEFARLLLVGAAWGLAATLFYDAARPLLKLMFGFSFNPYRAMPLFGSLMTGLPENAPAALVSGWIYHFWNGASFGMMFALVRPRGGIVEGLLWAMVLQALMMAVYPHFLQARLADPGFLWSGIVGHGLWGVVLGAGVRRSHVPRAGIAPA